MTPPLTALVEALRDVLTTAEYWYKKAHPDWDGYAHPQSSISRARAALSAFEAEPPQRRLRRTTMNDLLKAADAMAEALRLALGQDWEGIRWEGYAREALSAYKAAKREAGELVTDSDVLERCATAIAATFYGGSSGLDDMAQSIAEDHARACLDVLRPGDELPGGMVVVCKEPTRQMVVAGGEYVMNVGGIDPVHVDDRGPPWNIKGRETGSAELWTAMLAAAKEGKDE